MAKRIDFTRIAAAKARARTYRTARADKARSYAWEA